MWAEAGRALNDLLQQTFTCSWLTVDHGWMYHRPIELTMCAYLNRDLCRDIWIAILQTKHKTMFGIGYQNISFTIFVLLPTIGIFFYSHMSTFRIEQVSLLSLELRHTIKWFNDHTEDNNINLEHRRSVSP